MIGEMEGGRGRVCVDRRTGSVEWEGVSGNV